MAARFIPAVPRRPRSPDLAGQIASACCLAGITVALIQAGPAGWSSSVVVEGLALSVLAGIVFVVLEHRGAHPMLPLRLFSSATFSAATVVGLLINLGFYGELFVMTLYLQQIRGLSPLLAGAALLPQMTMAVIGSTISGRVTARTGPRLSMRIGLSVGAAGFLGLLAVGAHSAYWILIAPFIAVGLGMSFTMPAATTAVMEAAPPERAGLASGTLNAARQVGAVLGVALLGTLVAHQMTFIPGLRAGTGIAGGAFLAGAVLAAIAVERAHHQRG